MVDGPVYPTDIIGYNGMWGFHFPCPGSREARVIPDSVVMTRRYTCSKCGKVWKV